jgi:hypothetical protein
VVDGSIALIILESLVVYPKHGKRLSAPASVFAAPKKVVDGA